MSSRLIADSKTVEQLQQEAETILAQLRHSGRPIGITVRGKLAAVMLDIANFERLLRMLNLSLLVSAGEEDLHAGRVQSLDRFMSEFYRARKLSRPDHSRGTRGRSGNSRSHSTGQKERRRKVGS